ncbi:MAG: ABC-2 family transporter protein [Deinococcota bacterium]|nr:ABC-2 family transporter protein [Deinococcota bacterium]
MTLLPGWAQGVAAFLPFQWAFAFPIEVLIGQLTAQEILFGFLAQALWTLASLLIIGVLWRAGVRRYAAVGA